MRVVWMLCVLQMLCVVSGALLININEHDSCVSRIGDGVCVYVCE